MLYKAINVIAICLTILILVGGLMYFIWDFETSKNPYENCLDSCYYKDSRCMENCNDVFKEVALDFLDKTESIINEAMGDCDP